MNTRVPWNMEGVAQDTRSAVEPARRSGPSLGDWIDAVLAERAPAAGAAQRTDHSAEMQAIAAELARISDAHDDTRARVPNPDDQAKADASRDAVRDAVAEIARRQADLDRHGEAPDRPALAPEPPAPARRVPDPAVPPAERAPASRTPSPSGEAPAAAPWARPAPADETSRLRQAPVGLRRTGTDLSAEVSQTFARFSRDLRDAIDATDARPKVEALDRQVRRIGHAVEGLGRGQPEVDAIARIAEQTREMRDLLKASSGRSTPLDAVERQVAALETRLGRLAAAPMPAQASAAPPDFLDTMSEVRALLDGFKPGATMTALESRLDDITARIERGLDARGPAGLIEGLSRRVDEIHASLRTQLAESAVDTRPLEGLVRGLSDRIGQAREASADFQHLERAMRDVAAKIDGAAAAGIDGGPGVQAIEAQLARLAERLDRSEASLRAMDGVEHSLGELFSQFEVTRQVAIDAAETAARTAARDTLRAALQNPSLAQRLPESGSAISDQMARGLDDLRAMQDSAERRTQSTLADIRATVERLAQGMVGPAGPPARPPQDQRRRTAPPSPTADAARVALDPADLLIEPGHGRTGASPAPRAEPRFSPEPSVDGGGEPAAVDGDGPANFIAAARRAAQAAQASAALKTAERRAAPRAAGARRRAGAAPATSVGDGVLGRAKAFVAQRRRPILLSLAALVLLVGALEVVKLSVEPGSVGRTDLAESAVPNRARPTASAMAASGGDAASKAQAEASVPAAVLPPVAAAPARPPLPSFVAGPARAQAVAPVDGIGDGLRAQAAGGDAAAAFEVGSRYAEGRGVTRDPKQALAWFDKAAAQGLAPAEYRLGSAYEKGVGTERDPALAMSWYGKAADAGNIRAMHNLAVMSAEGAAGKPDYAKAAQWFGKASAYGVRDSQFNLAILYARGLGIEQSLSKSYTWFAIAAAEGDDDAAKKRDEVASKLDPTALAAAKSAADAFHATAAVPAANEVSPPPGGWDALPARSPGPANASRVSQL